MRWRLLVEGYGPEIEYIKGPKNVAVDALSRLPKQDDTVNGVDGMLLFVSVDEYMFPLHLNEIQAKKAKDRDMRSKIKDQDKPKSLPEDCGRANEDNHIQG